MVEDYDDVMWDTWVDDVICSKAFEACEFKDGNSNCTIVQEKRRCWYVMNCPLNKDRRER